MVSVAAASVLALVRAQWDECVMFAALSLITAQQWLGDAEVLWHRLRTPQQRTHRSQQIPVICIGELGHTGLINGRVRLR